MHGKNQKGKNVNGKNVKLSLRPIPPTLRGKKRYILLELLPLQAVGAQGLQGAGMKSFSSAGMPRLDERSVSRAVSDTMLSLFGSLGTAQRRVSIMKFYPEKSRLIIKCANEYCEEVKGALLFMREVAGTAVIPKILKVSGAIGKLK